MYLIDGMLLSFAIGGQSWKVGMFWVVGSPGGQLVIYTWRFFLRYLFVACDISIFF
jgi:hypothetical protein